MKSTVKINYRSYVLERYPLAIVKYSYHNAFKTEWRYYKVHVDASPNSKAISRKVSTHKIAWRSAYLRLKKLDEKANS
jgi:hypothetical protein